MRDGDKLRCTFEPLPLSTAVKPIKVAAAGNFEVNRRYLLNKPQLILSAVIFTSERLPIIRSTCPMPEFPPRHVQHVAYTVETRKTSPNSFWLWLPHAIRRSEKVCFPFGFKSDTVGVMFVWHLNWPLSNVCFENANRTSSTALSSRHFHRNGLVGDGSRISIILRPRSG